jgi:hypothetical protein
VEKEGPQPILESNIIKLIMSLESHSSRPNNGPRRRCSRSLLKLEVCLFGSLHLKANPLLVLDGDLETEECIRGIL